MAQQRQSKESERRQRQEKILELVKSMLQASIGECNYDEIIRVSVIRFGESPGFVEYLLRPFINSGAFALLKNGNIRLLKDNNHVPSKPTDLLGREVEPGDVPTDEMVDDILKARPVE